MDNTLIEAIKNNDLLKAQRALTEGMKTKVADILERERLVIAKSVVIEGEEPDEDEDDDEDDDE